MMATELREITIVCMTCETAYTAQTDNPRWSAVITIPDCSLCRPAPYRFYDKREWFRDAQEDRVDDP
jgi:hypothetical protein